MHKFGRGFTAPDFQKVSAQNKIVDSSVVSRNYTPKPFCRFTTKSCTFVTMPRADRLPRSASLLTTNSETSTQ